MANEKRTLRLSKEIAREAARFLEAESNHNSLITVMRVELAPKNQRATVLLSVLPETEEEKALEFANRRAGAFRKFLGQAARMRRLPEISFALDRGEKNRQRIEELSHAQ
ncbi:MAG: 30S ribosome-binding factor RbfA [bacterium]|nr:30S ribosome-binding factor RbfA [bacterium]